MNKKFWVWDKTEENTLRLDGVIAESRVTALERENSKLQTEIDVVLELLRKSVDENARTAINQAYYEKCHNALLDRFETTEDKKAEVEEKLKERRAKGEEIKVFMKKLEESENLLTTFDDELWNATVVRVVVGNENTVRFEFKDGQEVEWKI